MRKNDFLSIVKTPISFAGWFLTSLTFTLICIPFTFLPKSIRYKNRIYFFLTTIWSKLLVLFSFVRIKIRGTVGKTPAIIIMNHASALDIFLLETIVGTYPHIWLTKDEYTKIPLFSILLRRMHVPVKRKQEISAARAFLKVFHLAKQHGSHILIFPEGTRFSDGNIHEFHPGFALLAKKLNRPVVPIKTTGLHNIFPKGKIVIDYHASRPTATIGEPMFIKNGESVDDFSARVRRWFLQVE